MSIANCSSTNDTIKIDTPVNTEPSKKLVIPIINEASGIADSKTLPGHLWVQEDSGNPAQLILLNHNGKVVKKIPIKGVKNRDWEDMALVGNQLYLADIGDNAKVAKEYFIYHFKEPTSSTDTVGNVSVIRYKYPDGSHDAEAFLIDPKTKNILLITKTDTLSRVFKLTYPFAPSMNEAKLVGTLSYPYVVSAALSPNGKEAIVKTYGALYHYKQKSNESLETYLLKGPFKSLPYHIEPQGESVTFSATNSGYFTLSEKGLAAAVNLYFYGRE
ncbi:hypothetical protein DC20_10800 [Rufibacter tibetensis]|uniref:PE-PGRS family protein n=1 Tax=Rufibacter tibetensis TaxID=512763 RepID=A0A0P0CX72_9BACT|nr:hypothetical protein DC20_10800 [Rufibacter tibetensis]